MGTISLGLSAAPGLLYKMLSQTVRFTNKSPDVIEVNPDNSCAQFAGEKRVTAHSTRFSLFDAEFDSEGWIKRCQRNLGSLKIETLSVHYGTNSFADKKLWTFLPIDPGAIELSRAIDRLKWIQDKFECAIAIEVLALAMSKRDIFRQIESINKIISQSQTHLLLDLHNLFCQAKNYQIQLADLVQCYPLEKVIEIHVSGGSESMHNGRPFRRDTHDGAVPDEVVAILPFVASKCENLRWLILETQPEFKFLRFKYLLNDWDRVRQAVKGPLSVASHEYPPLRPETFEDAEDLRAILVREELVRKWGIEGPISSP